MDRRLLTVLGMSLVFALVVATVFYQLLGRGTAEAKAPPPTEGGVVIANKPLPVGVTIKAGDVRLEKVGDGNAPKGSFSKLEDVIDRPVVSNILLDEPVLAGRVAAKGTGLGLAPVIPVGMRAVSVRVTDVAGVAGFVLPGLRVDVLVTGRPPGNENTVTTTCLQNILVLSAGQVIQPEGNGQAIQTPTVTLLVSPEQAEVLTLAGNEGRIQLVLRNGSDQGVEKTPGSQLAQLYGAHSRTTAPAPPQYVVRPRPPVPVPTPPPPPVVKPAPPEVIVIRGNQRSVEPVVTGGN